MFGISEFLNKPSRSKKRKGTDVDGIESNCNGDNGGDDDGDKVSDSSSSTKHSKKVGKK